MDFKNIKKNIFLSMCLLGLSQISLASDQNLSTSNIKALKDIVPFITLAPCLHQAWKATSIEQLEQCENGLGSASCKSILATTLSLPVVIMSRKAPTRINKMVSMFFAAHALELPAIYHGCVFINNKKNEIQEKAKVLAEANRKTYLAEREASFSALKKDISWSNITKAWKHF